MAIPLHRTNPAPTAGLRRPGRIALIAWVTAMTGCVTENKTTGEMIPRGKQRYPWDKVQQLAEQLKDGMTKEQVFMLMGSPAEVDEADNLWIYLPERYGILVPARALRLEFKDKVLVEHSYRAIVLGTRL